jgi:hypothetical protein
MIQIQNIYSANTISVHYNSASGVSNQFDMISNILDHVIVTPSNVSINASRSQGFSAQGYDSFGNAIVSGIGYSWQVIGPIGNLDQSSGLSVTLTASQSVSSGFLRVSATQGAITKTADSTINIEPAALDHFSFPVIEDKTAGESFYLDLTAKDIYENTVTTFNGSINLSDDLGGIVPSTAGPFSLGTWTGSVMLTKSGQDRISATYGAISSFSNTIAVVPSSLLSGSDFSLSGRGNCRKEPSALSGMVKTDIPTISKMFLIPGHYLRMSGILILIPRSK